MWTVCKILIKIWSVRATAKICHRFLYLTRVWRRKKNIMMKRLRMSRKVLIVVSSRKIHCWNISDTKSQLLMKNVRSDFFLMSNNPINKKKLYTNYLLLTFFHGLNFIHIKYAEIILWFFIRKFTPNTKSTIKKLNNNFMNNLNFTSNNYNNNSKFIIFKGRSYNFKNLIKI